MIRSAAVGLLVAAGILLPAATAAAHSELIGSDPKDGTTVAQPPTTLRVQYSEPPVSADQLEVQDGCRDDVVASADVEGNDIVAELAAGQPGKWKVSSSVVSGVDGHKTDDGFTFTVRGRPDCGGGGGGTKTTEPDPPPAAGEDDSEGSSAVPLLLALGGGTLLLVLIALFLRRSS